MAVTSADCRSKLSALAQKDPFLNQADQRPLLDDMLTAIDAALKEALQRAEERLTETGQQLDAELAETAGQLRKAGEQLAEEFAATLGSRPVTTEAALRLTRSIEGRILWLYDRVRARLEVSMQRISPKGRPLGDILQNLAEVWSKNCREMPAELVLILDRRQQQQEAGRSIWEMEGPQILERACEGHGFLASRLLYLRQRHRLRRRYKIVRSEPYETLHRHQPAPLQKEPPAALLNCQNVHEETNRALADLWRNLRFNLENAAEDCSRLAAKLGDEEPAAAMRRLEETAKLAGETLARSAEQLTSVAEPFKQAWQHLLADLDRDRSEILALIPRDLLRELSWRERLQYARRRLVRAGRRWYEKGRKKLEKPRQFMTEGLAKATAFGRWLLGQSGTTRGREETLQKLSDLPTPQEILARANDLPPVCRRLFTIGALKNREFLVGKEGHLETLGDLFRRWQEGRLCSIAVVGPNGSGKTSLANCFQSELGNQVPVLRLGIDRRIRSEQQLIELCCRWFELPSPPENLADLEAQLLQLPPTVIIVENVHRLLLRTPGGLQCMRAFLRLVLASRRRLLWVITCRKYPWQRMQHLLQVDRYFTHQLQTLFGTQTEMREALLLRLQTSGYPVVFLKNSGDGNEPQKNGSDQETLQERFFTDLFAASRGNMQAALYFWLLCLDYDQGLESLTVRPLGKLDYGSLRSLDRQQFYALAEIIAHGELTAAEHAAIFACDLLRSDMLLSHLVQLNLLECAAEEQEAGRYRLNPLFFAPVTSTLEGRNILQ
jgi:hypothetical protein